MVALQVALVVKCSLLADQCSQIEANRFLCQKLRPKWPGPWAVALASGERPTDRLARCRCSARNRATLPLLVRPLQNPGVLPKDFQQGLAVQVAGDWLGGLQASGPAGCHGVRQHVRRKREKRKKGFPALRPVPGESPAIFINDVSVVAYGFHGQPC